jgi:xanthine dehydrogenase YagS FAD-binding subunit
MAALDASVVVTGRTGERSIRLTDLYRLPGDAPHRDTVLTHGELITAVDLPRLSFSQHSAYRKVRDRASYAFALISVAAALNLGDRRDAAGIPTIRDVRIAFGGVAHLGAPLQPRPSCAARRRVWRTSARLPMSSLPRRRHSTTTHSRSPW